MAIVYVLKLRNDKYYVGRTSNLERRIDDHKAGYGSSWTKKHKFVEMIKSFEAESPFYEDMIVKTMMQAHGIENVRGGSYSQVWLPKDQYTQLRREINGATDKCFHCGGDHFVKDCDRSDSDELDAFLKESIDVGFRICSSGWRKAMRVGKYFWA